MKRFFILSIALIISCFIFSQDFISGNPQWNVLLVGLPNVLTTEIYKIEGDSIMNSTEYKKVWYTYDSTFSSWTFDGLVREEGKVVYYVPPFASEGVLYDFNLETGESTFIKNKFCGDYEFQVTILDIDTVEYMGVDRRRWKLEGDFEEYWIEGIGNLLGPLHTKVYDCIVCPEWNLLCYFRNDSLFYKMPGEDQCYLYTGLDQTEEKVLFDIFPNPVKQGESLFIESQLPIKRITVFNTAGQPVIYIYPGNRNLTRIKTNELDKGLYLIKTESSRNRYFTQKFVIK